MYYTSTFSNIRNVSVTPVPGLLDHLCGVESSTPCGSAGIPTVAIMEVS